MSIFELGDFEFPLDYMVPIKNIISSTLWKARDIDPDK